MSFRSRGQQFTVPFHSLSKLLPDLGFCLCNVLHATQTAVSSQLPQKSSKPVRLVRLLRLIFLATSTRFVVCCIGTTATQMCRDETLLFIEVNLDI